MKNVRSRHVRANRQCWHTVGRRMRACCRRWPRRNRFRRARRRGRRSAETNIGHRQPALRPVLPGRGLVGRGRPREDRGRLWRGAPCCSICGPFTEYDARAFLSVVHFPRSIRPRCWRTLRASGIESLYENPLTLRMLGEVAQDDGLLPENRAQLVRFAACRVMLKERNRRQPPGCPCSQKRRRAAAGSRCPMHGTADVRPRRDIRRSERGVVGGLPERGRHCESFRLRKAANDVLRVRLFQSESENRFTHIPSCDRRVSRRQMARALLRGRGFGEENLRPVPPGRRGVPTSLRGLHAWMAHFNETLARALHRSRSLCRPALTAMPRP